MKLKLTSIFVLIFIILVVGCCLVACGGGGSGTVNKGGKNSLDVSTAMLSVYEAMKNSCKLQGANEDGAKLYVAFNGFTKAVGEYSTDFNFAADLDITSANLSADRNSKLAFSVIENTTTNSKFELYYNAGTLYILYSPTLVRVAISDFNLSQLVSLLYNSSESGKVKDTADLIVTLGNYLFSDCEQEHNGSNIKYTFTLDFNSLYSAFENVLTSADIGLTTDNVMDILGLSGTELYRLAGGSASVIINTTVKNRMESFVSAAYEYNETEPVAEQTDVEPSFSAQMSSFYATAYVAPTDSTGDGSDNAENKYPVIFPNNLKDYKYYNFANYDLSGVISLDVSSVNADSLFFNEAVSLGLSLNSFSCSYSFKSNYGADGLKAYLRLFDALDNSTLFELYYDSAYLYVNASCFLGAPDTNNGYLKLSPDTISLALGQLGVLKEGRELTPVEVASIIGRIFAKRVVSENQTTYTLNGDLLSILFEKLGFSCPLPMDGFNLVINTEGSSFKGLAVEARSQGVKLKLSADYPKVGFAVTVDTPNWLANCVDPSQAAQLTPVLCGEIASNIPNVTNTELVEALVYSLSGEHIVFEGEIASFKASANYSTQGKLLIFQVDFLTASGELVSTLYYYSQVQKLFVIMPENNGITVVHSLNLKTEGKFGEFTKIINGNIAVENTSDDLHITNNQKGFTFRFNYGGFNRLLERLRAVLPELLPVSLPEDLALQNVSFIIGEEKAIKGSFGGNRYINLEIDSYTLSYHSLALATTELTNHKDKTVSIYDNNNMAQQFSVVLGNEGTGRVMTVQAEAFGGWLYGDIPAIGSETSVVPAYIQVFGQTVHDDVTVNFADTGVSIDDNAEYNRYVSQENEKTFIFDRFNSLDDPIYVITEHFNFATVSTLNGTSSKSVVWKYDDVMLADAQFEPEDSYSIVPWISDFFGNTRKIINCSHNLKLIGSDVKCINNQDNFLTISAYSDKNPLDAATYYSVKSEVVLTDESVIEVSGLTWDITSITSSNSLKKNGVIISADKTVESLKSEFYALDGTFKIFATVYNSLGTGTRLFAVITVLPRIITNVTPDDLQYGVQYFSSAQQAAGASRGIFVIDPVQLNKLDSSLALAKKLRCDYNDNSQGVIDTLKWQVEAVKNVPLSSAEPIVSNLSVIVGNEIGGFQIFDFDYRFLSYDITSVSLLGNNNGINTVISVQQGYDTNVSFVLDKDGSYNPYNYIYPSIIVIAYGEISYTFDGVVHSIPTGTLSFYDVDWKFNDWDDKLLWQRGPDFKYNGSFTLCELKVDVQLSFLKKEIASWQFIDKNNVAISDSATPAVVVQHYVVADEGSYMLQNGNYVNYIEGTNTIRYNLDEGVLSNVYYAKPNPNDVDRLIIDPNTTEYLCYNSYPARAKVYFKGYEDAEIIPITWDLAALESPSIREQGFYSYVVAYLPLSQEMGKVNLWISGTFPDKYYVKAVFDNENSIDVKNSTNRIAMSLFGLKEGKLVVNDLSSVSTLHSNICGCSQPDCLGKLYFVYDDVNTQSGYFNVSEWQGLDKVSNLFKTALAAGTSVENITGDISLTAKVGLVSCPITLSIEQSVIVNPVLAGIPYANSSLFDSGASCYSMKANGLSLTIDPYLASPVEPSYYPTMLNFVFKGESGVALLDSWDCSAFYGKQLFNGHNDTAFAIINTPMGASVRIAVPTTIIPRVIEQVKVNGSTLKRIYVDSYSPQPFGINVEMENGRQFGYKSVLVKFANDDNEYIMSLKYDITDYTLSYAGQLIDSNVTVYVGNVAGGYQSVGGYSVYSKQNILLSVVCEETGVTSLIPGGQVFHENPSEKLFHNFGDTTEDNTAWEALTISGKKLILECGNYVPFEDTYIKVAETMVANAYTEGAQGLVYKWIRRDTDGKKYLYLQVWYSSSEFGDKLGGVQEICTFNEKYVEVTSSLFSLGSIGLGVNRAFNPTYTFESLLADNAISSSNNTFPTSALKYTLTKDGNVYAQDIPLAVGEYLMKVEIMDDKYTGFLSIELNVTPKEILEVTVKYGNNVVNSNPYSTYSGVPIRFYATCAENVTLVVECKDEGGNIVDEPQNVGTYKLTIKSSDSNYICTVNEITLVLEEEG